MEVRRARSGPGLRPGPRRQARRVGSGSARKGGSRRCFLRSGFCGALERIFGCPCGWRGRYGQCAAFRPGELIFRPATGALGAMPDGPDQLVQRDTGTLRRGPVAAGGGDAVRGSRRGRRARVRRTRRSCRPATARPPATLAASPCHPGRSALPRLLAPTRVAWPWPSGVARRRCALDDREEVLTASTWRPSDRPGADLTMATRGSRIAPRWCGWCCRRRSPTRRQQHERCPDRGAGSGRSFPGPGAAVVLDFDPRAPRMSGPGCTRSWSPPASMSWTRRWAGLRTMGWPPPEDPMAMMTRNWDSRHIIADRLATPG
jgi:hypothetical protein